MTLRTGLAILVSAAFAHAAGASPALTNAADAAMAIVRPSHAKAGFAMTARVMQVYRTSDVTELAVEDDTGGVILKGYRTSADVSPGDMVRATGHIRPGLADVPEATFTNIEFISSGPGRRYLPQISLNVGRIASSHIR